jgi:TIR domain
MLRSEATKLANTHDTSVQRITFRLLFSRKRYIISFFQGPSRSLDLAERRSRRSRNQLASVRVVLSYAHRDEKLQQELNKHFSALRRSALIEGWHDRRIMPGSNLDQAINRQLERAHLVLLLISPDFLDSDYCYCREMRTALRRHAKGHVRVIPIILRPVDWIKTPIGKLLALPRDGKAITTWTRRDDAFLDVAKGVRRAAEDILSGNSRFPSSQAPYAAKFKRTPGRSEISAGGD